MLGKAGAILVAKEDAVRIVVHVDGLVVGRWCKDVVDVNGWFLVCARSGGDRFGVKGWAWVWFYALFDELVTG